jgi:predicted dehydrogenase
MAPDLPARWRAAVKLVRFVCIYGPGRTLYKAAGRLRLNVPRWTWRRRSPDIGVIGCGQFAFSTIGYFLRGVQGHRLGACYDIDHAARDSLARALRVPRACESVQALLDTPGLRTVYVASNHASHSDYATQALARGLDVVVEKPIAVNRDQLVTLLRARRASHGRLFAGYNRPFSAAVRELRQAMAIVPGQGLSMQCFVAGHQLAPDHWYRRPEEGTRVCGNLGHWLDLWVHLLSWRDLPDKLELLLGWADASEPDDNLALTITSDKQDLFTVMLSSRHEPFEGIQESIHVQHGDTLCRIDDFRAMRLWQGARVRRRRYWPKDVGHRAAIRQPFAAGVARDWHEVELSTLLMLHVTDMVRGGVNRSQFSFQRSWAALARDIEAP